MIYYAEERSDGYAVIGRGNDRAADVGLTESQAGGSSLTLGWPTVCGFVSCKRWVTLFCPSSFASRFLIRPHRLTPPPLSQAAPAYQDTSAPAVSAPLPADWAWPAPAPTSPAFGH
jgi:hypothetical protein